uniref:Uncharacterized protein n=1 Tax=Romanomermis culicivorax TaxID=13658 RepID=A0A915L451_ROMCU
MMDIADIDGGSTALCCSKTNNINNEIEHADYWWQTASQKNVYWPLIPCSTCCSHINSQIYAPIWWNKLASHLSGLSNLEVSSPKSYKAHSMGNGHQRRQLTWRLFRDNQGLSAVQHPAMFLLEENRRQEEGPQKEKKKNMKKGNNGGERQKEMMKEDDNYDDMIDTNDGYC